MVGDLFRSPTVGDLTFFLSFYLQNRCQPLDVVEIF